MKQNLIIVFLFSSSLLYGQVDSLINLLGGQSGKERISVLHTIVKSLWLNHPSKAMKYGNEALALSREIKDSLSISESLRLMSAIYHLKGDHDKSMIYYKKSLNIAISIADTSLIYKAYNNIGVFNYNMSSYQTAMEYLLRAKILEQKVRDTYSLATTLNNIGKIFEKINHYKKARKYFKEAYDLAKSTKNLATKLRSTNNIGITYLKENKLDSAIIHFRKGLKIASMTKDTNEGTVSRRGIGEVLMMKGERNSAQYFFQKSLDESISIKDTVESYFLMSKNALERGFIKNAIEYLDKCNELTTQINLEYQQLKNYLLYSKIYSAKKNTNKENEYLIKHIELRDSLFRKNIAQNLDMIPLKLKEEEDRFIMYSQQAKIRVQMIVYRLFMFIIVLIIPLLVILIILLWKNQKRKKKLLQNNEEIKKTQKLLVSSEKMASLGVLAAGVGHEINNPLNFIKNGIEVITKKIENSNLMDNELKSYFKIINEGVDRTTNIVKSLSHFSRKTESIKAQKCNAHQIIENCLLILQNKIKNKIRVIINFTKNNANIKGNEGKLHQVIMNIIVNAIHAIKGKGIIEITTIRNKKCMEITIKDNGEGIPKDNLIKINDPFFTTKPAGEGTGLGLYITSSIIEEHNGDLNIKSNLNQGTSCIITLPV